MFVWKEAGYQLFRNRGRTVLLCCISAVLCGCIAFYLGNIEANRKALNNLNESTPAVLHLTNMTMDSLDEVNINMDRFDALELLGLRSVTATSRERGCLETPYDNRNLENGDTEIRGLSSLEAAGMDSEEFISYAPGMDRTCLEGEEPLCLLSEEYAGKHGFSLGDIVSLQLCQVAYDSFRSPVVRLISQEKAELRVAGIFSKTCKPEVFADLYLPVKWVRSYAEQAGADFYYASMSATLLDSMNLNTFKEKLKEMGYYQPIVMGIPTDKRPDLSAANTVFFEDQNFIKAAEKLGSAVRYYRFFLLPFLFVVTALITLAIFLVLRSTRRDMAIACSLGRPKGKTALANLLAALSAQLAGCVLTLPVILLLTGLSLQMALTVCGAFLLCALLGDLVGLMVLLRFDAMSLLLQSE